jgi:hypothetical protein
LSPHVVAIALVGAAALWAAAPPDYARAAIAAPTEAVKVRADFTLNNLAILEWNTGRRPEAAGHIRTALTSDHRDRVTNACAALVDMEANDAAGATKHVSTARDGLAALDPLRDAALAAFFGQRGVYDKAEQAPRHSLSSDAMNLLAPAYEKDHRTQEATDTSRATRLKLQMGVLDALSRNSLRAQAEFAEAARLEPASDVPGAVCN